LEMRLAVDELATVLPSLAPELVFTASPAIFTLLALPSNASTMPHKAKLANKAYRFIMSLPFSVSS
jgi:hypothetical protein